MINLSKFKKSLSDKNRDIIIIYRLIIYSYKNYFIKYLICRMFVLSILFFKKYILKINIFKELDKIKNSPCKKTESKASKRRNIVNISKLILEQNIIFFDISNLLFMNSLNKKKDFECIDEKILEKSKINSYIDLYEVNPYGKLLYDIVIQNNKKVILLFDNEDIEKNKIIKLLNKNYYKKYNEILYCDLEYEKRRDFLKSKTSEYKNESFAYVGSYIKPIEEKDSKNWKIEIYENCNFWGQKFRDNKESSLELSIYKAMVNNKMHNGLYKYTKEYEFGYIYVGIVTYYIIIQMIKNKTVFKEEYNKLYNRIKKDLKIKTNKLLELFFETCFPKSVNNLAYDESVSKRDISMKNILNIEYEKDIQEAAIYFIKEYEERLLNILGKNDIQYSDILCIIRFFLTNNNSSKQIIKNLKKGEIKW